MGTPSRSDGRSGMHVDAGTDGLRDSGHTMNPARPDTTRPTTTTAWRDRDPESGFDPVGTAITVPAVFLVLALTVAFARVTSATQDVSAAVYTAARAASLARTPGTAKTAAARTATQELTTKGIGCTGLDTAVDTSGYATRVGQPATVTVTLTCRVPLSDIALPGLPGSKTITARAASPLDTFRERPA